MSTVFTLKKGALLPEVELTLTPSGYTYDLNAASSVQFRYYKKGSDPVAGLETIACTVTDAALYKVKLTPTAELVDVEGTHLCHVKVTIGGKDLYFPHEGFDDFKITKNF